jgi:shikimate dehydrogenase
MDRYAVIGNPVAHSLSPRIHGLFAEQTGQALVYEQLLAPLDGFSDTAQRFFREGGSGLNVTVPFKSQAADWVTELDDSAAAAQAVNTIALSRPDGARETGSADRVDAPQPDAATMVARRLRTVGFNTDGAGLVRDLIMNHQLHIEGKRILVLGAGGAVQGVLRPLLAERPAELCIANRTAEKAQQLALALNREALCAEADVRVTGLGLDALKGGFDIVISGTSAGLSGDRASVPAPVVRGAFCYDMIYGAQTDFCRWAEANGARGVTDGIGMLVEQAALAFDIWRGVAPETAPVLRLLRQERTSQR